MILGLTISTNIILQIFDKNMSLNPHTLENIFSLGGGSKEIFNSKLNNLMTLLKPDGALFLFISNPERIQRPKRFQSMFQDFFNSVPEKFHKRFKEIMPRFDFTRESGKLLNNAQIKEILQNNFEELQIIKYNHMCEIFIARIPKKEKRVNNNKKEQIEK